MTIYVFARRTPDRYDVLIRQGTCNNDNGKLTFKKDRPHVIPSGHLERMDKNCIENTLRAVTEQSLGPAWPLMDVFLHHTYGTALDANDYLPIWARKQDGRYQLDTRNHQQWNLEGTWETYAKNVLCTHSGYTLEYLARRSKDKHGETMEFTDPPTGRYVELPTQDASTLKRLHRKLLGGIWDMLARAEGGMIDAHGIHFGDETPTPGDQDEISQITQTRVDKLLEAYEKS